MAEKKKVTPNKGNAKKGNAKKGNKKGGPNKFAKMKKALKASPEQMKGLKQAFKDKREGMRAAADDAAKTEVRTKFKSAITAVVGDDGLKKVRRIARAGGKGKASKK